MRLFAGPASNIVRQWLINRIDTFRHRLAHTDALSQLTLLGFLAGIGAALLVVAFRLSIDTPLGLVLAKGSEDFESLPPLWRFTLAAGGGLLIGAFLQWLPASMRQVSVGHIIDRMHNHQSRIPLANMLVQFIGGVLCLLTGQSVGREGPAVHLGAAAGSLLGQWLKAPHNCLRTLVGCGVAAAIAASFNTPIAGVIFAMEVVLMEYTIMGFLPIIMASVTGAAVSRMIFGPEPAFSLPPIQMNSLWELPYIALSGLTIAATAAAFIKMQLLFNRCRQWPIIVRTTLAGTLTGGVAIYVPQVMGVGYDTVGETLQGHIGIGLLTIIISAKLLTATASIGLGQPGGVIGPIFMIGAMLGGLMGLSAEWLLPDNGATTGFYVMLGMGALVAAVLNAPLAGLMAVLELTYNPNIIFPCMLVIVVACVTTRQVFRCEGLFLGLLAANNNPIRQAPLRQVLDRVGVRSVMDSAFTTSSYQLGYSKAHELLRAHPRWLVAEELGQQTYLLPAADLAKYLEDAPVEILSEEIQIDLREIPARRQKLIPIHEQASLYEAQRLLNQEAIEALYVERPGAPLLSPVLGIITRDTLEAYYQL